MSEAAIKSEPGPDVRAEMAQRRLFNSLFWKEFREIGFYGLVIMACGFVVVAVGPLLVNQTGMSSEYREIISSFAALARVFPILLVMACGSASFAIEHENRSYQFLRSLPITISQLFWIKVLNLALLTVVCCLVFWPYAYYLWRPNFDVESSFFSKLPPTAISIGEAFLWSLCFSLRDRRVIPALIKAGLGFMVVTNGIALISRVNFDNETLDTFYFFLILTCRSTAVVVLVIFIRKAVSSWLDDSVTTSDSSSLVKDAIGRDQPSRFALTRRLLWLQWRGNAIALLTLMSIIVGMILATALAGYGSMFSYGYGQLIWVLSVAFLGVIAFKSCGDKSRLLVSSGYHPFRIWVTHSLPLLVFCLVSAVAISLVGESMGPLGLYIHFCLIGFAVGQFVSMFFTSTITSCFVSAFALIIALSVYMFATVGFEQLFPILVTLCILPLALVGFFRKRLATTGKLGSQFWIIGPPLFVLSLAPLPYLRIYEAPTANTDAIFERAPSLPVGAMDSLAEVRKIGDQVIELWDQIQDGPGMHYGKQRSLFAERIYPLIQMDTNHRILLQNGEGNPQDLKRWEFIQSALGRLKSELGEQIKINSADHQQVDQTIRNWLNWHSYFFNHQVLYWWVHHPQTKSADVRELIGRLEDEEELFDSHQAFALANHQYAMAAVSTKPDEYPILAGYSWISPKLVIGLCPWEVERFKRFSNTRLKKEWDAITALRAIARKKDAGYQDELDSLGVRRDYQLNQDLIAGMLSYFRSGDSRGMTRNIFYRRIDRLYLAVALWQKEHAGKLPRSLSELEDGYLKKVPVSPSNGEPFYLAPEGLTADQFKNSRHIEFLETEWQGIRLFSDNPPGSPVGQPFIWINDPEKNDRHRTGPAYEIRAVEEFATVKETANISFWIFPKLIADE